MYPTFPVRAQLDDVNLNGDSKAEKVNVNEIKVKLTAANEYRVYLGGPSLNIQYTLDYEADSKKPTADSNKYAIDAGSRSGFAFKGYWVGIGKLGGDGKAISQSDAGNCDQSGCGNYLMTAGEGFKYGGLSETLPYKHDLSIGKPALDASGTAQSGQPVKTVSTFLIPVVRLGLTTEYDYKFTNSAYPITIKIYADAPSRKAACIADKLGTEAQCEQNEKDNKQAFGAVGSATGTGDASAKDSESCILNPVKCAVSTVMGSLTQIVVDIIKLLFITIQAILYAILAWVIVPMIQTILNIRLYTDDFVSLAQPGVKLFTGLSGILFVLAMLAAGFQKIMGGSQSIGGKISVPKILLGAVLINFSTAFYQAVMGVGEWFLFQFFPNTQPAIDAVIWKLVIQPQGSGWTDGFAKGFTPAVGSLASTFLSFVVAIMVTYIFVRLLWFVLKRVFTSFFVVMIAPLFFVAMAVPGMKAIQNLIWKTMKENIIFLPVLLIFLNLAGVFATTLGPQMEAYLTNTGTNNSYTLDAGIKSLIATLLPNLILMGVLSQGMKIAKQASESKTSFGAADKFAAGDFKGGFRQTGKDAAAPYRGYEKLENTNLGKEYLANRAGSPVSWVNAYKENKKAQAKESADKASRVLQRNQQRALRLEMESNDPNLKGSKWFMKKLKLAGLSPQYAVGRMMPTSPRNMYMKPLKRTEAKQKKQKEQDDAIKDRALLLDDPQYQKLLADRQKMTTDRQEVEARKAKFNSSTQEVSAKDSQVLLDDISRELGAIKNSRRNATATEKTELDKRQAALEKMRDKVKTEIFTNNKGSVDLTSEFGDKDLGDAVRTAMFNRMEGNLSSAVAEAKQAEAKLVKQVTEQQRIQNANGLVDSTGKTRGASAEEREQYKKEYTKLMQQIQDRKSTKSVEFEKYMKQNESESMSGVDRDRLSDADYAYTEYRKALMAKELGKARGLIKEIAAKGNFGDLLKREGHNYDAEGAMEFFKKNKDELLLDDKGMKSLVQEVSYKATRDSDIVFSNLVEYDSKGDLQYTISTDSAGNLDTSKYDTKLRQKLETYINKKPTELFKLNGNNFVKNGKITDMAIDVINQVAPPRSEQEKRDLRNNINRRTARMLIADTAGFSKLSTGMQEIIKFAAS